MAEITAKQVKSLRDLTNAGMMECRKALMESGGDEEAAVRWLRERGMAIAAKKADRAASEGLVNAEVSADAQTGVMVEVNCETDFVAKNENFGAFVKELTAESFNHADGALAEAVKDTVTAKISQIGENIVVSRNARYEVQGTGAIASYIHMGGKMGVLLELGFEKADTASNPAVASCGREICMHIAASNPVALNRDGVPAETVANEKEVFAKQVEDKPEQIREKIVTGKLEKFFSQCVLLEQAFVIDPDLSIGKLLEKVGGEVGDTLSIRRYTCYKLGVAG